MQLGVDVGGTFTDAVLAGRGELHTAKVPSTPGDQSRGVLAAVEAVVCLLHSYRHPDHERELARALAAEAGGIHVSLSHELVGTFREFERAATTEVDAALSPLLGGYLQRLRTRTRDAGLPAPAIM